MDEEEIKTPPDLVMLLFSTQPRKCAILSLCALVKNFNLQKSLGIFKWEFCNGMQHCDTSYALTANQKLLNCKYLMEIIWSHIWKYQAVYLSYTPAIWLCCGKKKNMLDIQCSPQKLYYLGVFKIHSKQYSFTLFTFQLILKLAKRSFEELHKDCVYLLRVIEKKSIGGFIFVLSLPIFSRKWRQIQKCDTIFHLQF